MQEYYDWVIKRPAIANFRYVRRLLQYLQWQDGGKRGRPWILKSIGNIANMEALLECYPKSTIMHVHRDPCKAIASFAKVETYLWEFKANPVDRKMVGETQIKWWSAAMNRYLETRDRLKLDDRILDVSYQQMRDDPMPVMHEIYHRAGRKMSAEAEQAMRQWNLDNEQHQHGKHEYSLEEFGLSNAVVNAAFAEYIRRYIRP